MAGWTRYNEHTGEIETGMYDCPFIVRATPKTPCGEDTTIVGFRTEAEAREWIEKNKALYTEGLHGYACLHIENWNVDGAGKQVSRFPRSEEPMGIAPGIRPPGWLVD